MVRRSVEYEIGSSTTGLHGRTLIGSLLGEKNSTREVKKFLWHPSKRKYRRVKTVFECANCYGSGATRLRQFSLGDLSVGKVLKIFLIIFIGWNVLVGVFRGLSEKDNEERVEPNGSAQAASTTASSRKLTGPDRTPESSIATSAADADAAAEELSVTKNPLEGLPPPSSSEGGRVAEASTPSLPPSQSTLAKISRMPSSEEYYPRASKRDGEQGTTLVKVCINSSGRMLGSPTVLQSSGFDRLDEGAIRLARAGRYQAGTIGGDPLPESCVRFLVRFVIDE
jgi:TonB family protein